MAEIKSETGNVMTYEDGIITTVGGETYTVSGDVVPEKADKVSDAVSGNFAGLDADGNLTDSGKKPADFVEANAPIIGNSNQTWFPKWDTKGLVTGQGLQAFASTLKLNGVTKPNFIYTTSLYPIEIDYSNKQEKPSNVTSGSDITLADNTEYRLEDVSTLSLTYPTGNFEVYMRITTMASGAVTITFPVSTKYIGDIPNFGNDETWELSIKDGVIVAGKVEAV